MTLPASLEELRGLRAARWTRESSKGQADRFGPAAQADEQTRAIERFGLTDSGLAWSIAHSGWRRRRHELAALTETPEWTAMLEAAGRDYDVLVVGYVSRFIRDAEAQFTFRRLLHRAGAALLFATEGVLSSDDRAWESWAREAVEAESYSRRLSRSIRDGLAAKHRLERDPGSGEVSLGFRRVRGLVEPDPDTMPTAIEVYRRSAAGASDRDIAEALSLGLWPVRTILRSPLYAGRLPDGRSTRFAAPVSAELVEAAREQRRRRTWSGRSRGRRVYPLSDRGPLVCAACGRPLKGVFRTDVQRRLYRHPESCGAGPAEARADELEAQVGWMLERSRPNRESAARIRAALAQPAIMPDRIAAARIDAELRRLALSLIERPDPVVLRRMDELRAEREALEPVDVEQPDADEAIEWLSDLGTLWRETSDEGRRALAVATFARLGMVDRRIVDVEATPLAERRGLALALPTRVTGVGGTGVLAGPVTWPLRVANRRAWLRAARTA